MTEHQQPASGSESPRADGNPQDFAPGLLHAALALPGALELPDLVMRMSAYVFSLPSTVAVGLGVFDDERHQYETHTLFSATAGVSDPKQSDVLSETFQAELSDVPDLLETATFHCIADLCGEPVADHLAPFRDRGARAYVVIPLRLGDRLLGGLRAGFAEPKAPDDSVMDYLIKLGRIVSPVLWNCHNELRFKAGDRRRDTLMELSDKINKSLNLKNVLDSAREAIGRLPGHCVSGIGLLEEDSIYFRSYRRYQQAGESGHQPDAPEVILVSDSAMGWVIKHGRSYQSDDLAVKTQFANDKKIRENGVRRYVSAPMYARGRIIGAFFFGSNDARPVLPIDVWFYENIALQLALSIDNATQYEKVRKLSDTLAEQNVYLREEIRTEHNFGEMIGASPAMQRVSDAIRKVAKTSSTVLITGETGVGKELVARALHALSPRVDLPMVKVNCAAIPEGMVESELFGHERGAFTSAIERRIGRFELAREGTIFLDEVGELSPAIQAKLLTVLQDGQFERVGGTKTLTTDARIISATNRNLEESINNGSFRSDLFYRLNVFPIRVPSLAERRDDIPLLVEFFVGQFSRNLGKPIVSIDRKSLNYLCERDWPGNVRELRHVIERAMILSPSDHLLIPEADAGIPAQDAPEVTVPTGRIAKLEEVEADHLRRALEQTGGVIEGIKGAAALVGLKASTFRFRMKRLGIKRTPEHKAYNA